MYFAIKLRAGPQLFRLNNRRGFPANTGERVIRSLTLDVVFGHDDGRVGRIPPNARSSGSTSAICVRISFSPSAGRRRSIRAFKASITVASRSRSIVPSVAESRGGAPRERCCMAFTKPVRARQAPRRKREAMAEFGAWRGAGGALATARRRPRARHVCARHAATTGAYRRAGLRCRRAWARWVGATLRPEPVAGQPAQPAVR